VIEDARDHLREIKKLQKFEFVDADGKDQGINIREKARQLIELLNSDEQLNAEREKARTTRNKYSGVSAADMSSGGGGAQRRQPEVKKGFSDDDFKYAADRSRQSSQPDAVLGLTSIVGGLVSSATEYASAASKQLQSMQTLFRSRPDVLEPVGSADHLADVRLQVELGARRPHVEAAGVVGVAHPEHGAHVDDRPRRERDAVGPAPAVTAVRRSRAARRVPRHLVRRGVARRVRRWDALAGQGFPPVRRR